uniref:Uncharacterized protein n=1 Tax=Onchocerca volvulus TaxID=6282 RepID=A0A8R1XPQ5_ONCVO
MSIIVAERHFSVCRWLSKLYYSVLQRKSFKRLELENCAEKLGTTDQILVQRKLERSGSICFSNTSNRTMHLKNLEKKVNPHSLIIVNHLSNDISLSNHVRKPLIKFIGARLPLPHYDRSSLPPLVYESQSSTSQGLLSSSNVPSSAVQTKIKQGTLIEDLQLPVSLRRKLISEEECNVINSGGAYGLESTSKDNR